MADPKDKEKVFQLRHLGNNCFLNSSYQLLFSIKTFYNLKNYNDWILYYIKYAYDLNHDKEKSEIEKFINDDILLTIIRELINIDNKKDGNTYVDIIKMQQDIGEIMLRKELAVYDYTGKSQEDAFFYMSDLLMYLQLYLIDMNNHIINNSENLMYKFFKSIQVTINDKRHFYNNGTKTETTYTKSNDSIFYIIEPLKYKNFGAKSVEDYINKVINMKGYIYQGQTEGDMKYYEKSFEEMPNNEEIIRCVECDVDFSQYIIFLILRTDYSSSIKNTDRIQISEKLSFKGINYFLKSLIYHGGSRDGGHYINYSKKNGKWYNLNDEYWDKQLRTIDYTNIENSDTIQRNCYVLLYEKEKPSQQ